MMSLDRQRALDTQVPPAAVRHEISLFTFLKRGFLLVIDEIKQSAQMVLIFKILRCFKSSSCNEISRFDQPGRPGNNMSNYIVVTPWEETVEKEGLSGQGERQPPPPILVESLPIPHRTYGMESCSALCVYPAPYPEGARGTRNRKSGLLLYRGRDVPPR